MENFNRLEIIKLYAGLTLPGLIRDNNIFYTHPKEIAERAFAIAEAMADMLETKYKECEKLKTESNVN